MKNILFVCRHNIFRSKVAEKFFNKFNENKKYRAKSAGLFKWSKSALRGDVGYKAEKKIAREFGINLDGASKGIDHDLLKESDIIVLVADDVDPSVFTHEEHFYGKLIVWKITDVKSKHKNKYDVALSSVKKIEKKVKDFIRRLR